MAEKLKFTKARLESIKPGNTRKYYQDTTQPKLGLYVTPSGTKTYFARLYLKGGITRRPIGRFPEMSVPLARDRAGEAAAALSRDGVDPVKLKRKQKALALTLNDVLEEYISSKTLKPGTVTDYRRAIKENFGAWMDKPLSDITETMVQKRYLERGKKSRARTANGARVLGALFNFARVIHKDEAGESHYPLNPVDTIKEAGIRFRPQRKRRIIASEDLPVWWKALQSANNEESRLLIQFCLFTGARKGEAAAMRWEDINFRAKRFTIRDPKNREPIELPLPTYLSSRLEKHMGRKQSGWVFPKPYGKPGHIDVPSKTLAHIRKESGVDFSLHDLRRTFISTANGLDISPYTTKWLVNHRFSEADVTAGYDVPEMDRLKAASAKIEERILRLVGESSSKVILLQKKANAQ